MNSKMMALAAVLVVGVLAAAGVGYAYTAQYTSPDNAVDAQYALVKEILSTDNGVDYDTEFDDSTDNKKYTATITTAETDKTITVTVDTLKLPDAATGKKWQVKLADGSTYKVFFNDGSTSTGGTNLTQATTGALVTSVSGIALTCDAQDITKGATSTAVITLAGTIVSDEGAASGAPTDAALCYITGVEFTLEYVQVDAS